MSDTSIGGMVDRWELLDRDRRDGRVELWQNHDSGYYGVYLYEHVQHEEEALLFKIRKTREEAERIFYTVADMLV